MSRVRLKYCSVERKPYGITTYFDDECESSVWPQDTDFYAWVVGSLEFESQVEYAFMHDLTHNVVAEVCFDRPSYVVWQSAHALDIDPAASAAEERLVYYLQQYRAGKIPCIDPQWAEVDKKINEVLLLIDK